MFSAVFVPRVTPVPPSSSSRRMFAESLRLAVDVAGLNASIWQTQLLLARPRLTARRRAQLEHQLRAQRLLLAWAEYALAVQQADAEEEEGL